MSSSSSSDQKESPSPASDSSSDKEGQDESKDRNGRPTKKPKTTDRPASAYTTTTTAATTTAHLPASAPLHISTDEGGHTKFGEANKSQTTAPIIVLLDQATLETVKNKRGMYELLNCDDHRELCRKKLHKDPNEFRPDILHQELLALLDSPLNKAGLLKVYIHTKKHVLIDIHPSIRIPRTYKRFSGLMVQLLHKMKIKAGSESTTLLKVIKNPFSQYLPPGTRCYGMSCQGTLYSPIALARTLLPATPPDLQRPSSPPTCFIVGAMSTGHVQLQDHPYMERMISVSNYPLSGAAALSRIMVGIEHLWGIV